MKSSTRTAPTTIFQRRSRPVFSSLERRAARASRWVRIYCPDEGCTIVATPDADRLFEGWCRNAAHTGVLSYEEQYRFSPDDDPAVIYAYFR